MAFGALQAVPEYREFAERPIWLVLPDSANARSRQGAALGDELPLLVLNFKDLRAALDPRPFLRLRSVMEQPGFNHFDAFP